MDDIATASANDLTAAFDIAVIGAGIAGASLAAECGQFARVLVVEAEDTPGYHTTGRSAAFWEESYGGPAVVPLTAASGVFLDSQGFLSPRAGLTIGRAQDLGRIEAFVDRFAPLGVDIRLISREAMVAMVPGLQPEWCHGAYEAKGADIDVAGLHQLYLAQARRSGSVLKVRARITQTSRDGGDWRIEWTGGTARAAIVVNAAGAWADPVAALFGAAALGINPLRRGWRRNLCWGARVTR